MSVAVIYTVVTLAFIGTSSAVILYFVAQKFKVTEDPRIGQVEDVLPGVNCGGCGFAGCAAFANALVKEMDLSRLFCPVGGNESMAQVGKILGLESSRKDPKVAVVRCNGSCEVRPRTNHYDGAATCAIISLLYSGETGCYYGCLGYGDCCVACSFDAIHMNKATGLPEVIDSKCNSCGACVKACPKNLIELRKKNPKDRKIYVACRNEEKGALARKSCEVACIACGKCETECTYEAIKISKNLAFIDPVKCRLCRKCVSVCPTNSILEIGFPPRRIKPEAVETVVEDQS